MLIENITAPDDYTTLFALKATVTLTEIITAKTQAVLIEKTGTTKKGTIQPIPKKNVSKPVQAKVEEKVINKSTLKVLSGI